VLTLTFYIFSTNTATLDSSNEIIKLLIERGAKVNARESRYGLTSLDIAQGVLATAKLYGKEEIIQTHTERIEMLVKYGSKTKADLGKYHDSPTRSDTEPDLSSKLFSSNRRHSDFDKHATSVAVVGLVAIVANRMFRSNSK
jgi:hypothetical protein